MKERYFYKNSGPYSLFDIAKLINCSTEEKFKNIKIEEVKSLTEATNIDITFLSNKKYKKEFLNTKAVACIVPEDFNDDIDSNCILLKVKNPYYAYMKVFNMFYSPEKVIKNEIKDSAHVSSKAKIGNNCYIGHNVVIEDEAEIGDNSYIEANSYIGYKVKIGNNARIDANVSIDYAIIGDNVVLLPGVRIGQDGFGFATENGMHTKIYHIGRVVIGNDVEIGANSCIDRGSNGDTIIEDFVRVDNLVQIGHNVHIKKGAILVSQVGIAGSSTVGSYSALGGQVGVAGHIKIGDNVQAVGQSGIIRDVADSEIIGGTPAIPVRDWHKQTILMKKLIKK